MIKRLTPITAALAAIAATALGGVALANSTSTSAHRHAVAARKAASAHRVGATETTGSGIDGDNVQSGD